MFYFLKQCKYLVLGKFNPKFGLNWIKLILQFISEVTELLVCYQHFPWKVSMNSIFFKIRFMSLSTGLESQVVCWQVYCNCTYFIRLSRANQQHANDWNGPCFVQRWWEGTNMWINSKCIRGCRIWNYKVCIFFHSDYPLSFLEVRSFYDKTLPILIRLMFHSFPAVFCLFSSFDLCTWSRVSLSDIYSLV